MHACVNVYVYVRNEIRVLASPFLSAGNKNIECPPDPFIERERVETAAKSRTGSIDLEATALLAITAKAIWEAFF